MAHLVDKHFVERANRVLLLGIAVGWDCSLRHRRAGLRHRLLAQGLVRRLIPSRPMLVLAARVDTYNTLPHALAGP